MHQRGALILLVAALFIVSCRGGDTITGANGEQVPLVAGVYRGMVTDTPSTGSPRTCNGTAVVQQQAALVDFTLTGDCVHQTVSRIVIRSSGFLERKTDVFFSMGGGAWFQPSSLTVTTEGYFRDDRFHVVVTAAGWNNYEIVGDMRRR